MAATEHHALEFSLIFATARKETVFTELTMKGSRFLTPPPTEEAFVLATLKEFVKLWGSGHQANF